MTDESTVSYETQTANRLFEQYVEHSYRYYGLDDPSIPDAVYDQICRDLYRVWDNVTHPDKHLTNYDALEAGTGYQMMFNWPEWVVERVHGARS